MYKYLFTDSTHIFMPHYKNFMVHFISSRPSMGKTSTLSINNTIQHSLIKLFLTQQQLQRGI